MITEQMKKDKIAIRPMIPEDISACLEIDRKITGVGRAVTHDYVRSAELGGELVLSFIADFGGKIVGLIMARRIYVGDPVIETGLIQILSVDPAYQGQDIGTKLVNSVLEKCRSLGITTIRVLVNERNSELQGLFQHLDFYHDHLIDYTKTL